jgi:sulfite reductase (NADPH) flavoprotein alpha-component
MINSERRVTLTQKAVEPPGDALADWKILVRLAHELGFAEAFPFRDAGEVFEEATRFANPRTDYDLRGMSHRQLRHGPMQWPCGPGESAGRAIRYRGETGDLRFPTATGRARFFARPYLPPDEMPDADFPLILTTGRVANQWHTRTKTGHVARLNALNPGPFVEIHPEDAALLGLREDQQVEVRSRRGAGVYPARVTDRIRPGACFVPFHWNESSGAGLAINEVTSDACDAISGQPELKFCAVRLSPATAHPAARSASQTDEPFTSGQKIYLRELISTLARGSI